jgi:hypothetical protein
MQIEVEENGSRRGMGYGMAVIAVLAAALTPFLAPYI